MNNLRKTYRQLLARKLNTLINTHERVAEVGCGSGILLRDLIGEKTGIERDQTVLLEAMSNCKDAEFVQGEVEKLDLRKFDTLILSDLVTRCDDIQNLLSSLYKNTNDNSRLIIGFHNNLWRPILSLGYKLGVSDDPVKTWVSKEDMDNFCELSGWEVFRNEACTLIPLKGPVWDQINKYLAPLCRFANLSLFVIARKKVPKIANKISILIPVRNEAGTIASALERIPDLGKKTEILFIEGNSKDNTWEVLQTLPKEHNSREIVVDKQPGIGKGDAVRHGFSKATGDILLILDGDLTMPPEELPKYIEALESGTTDFANGSRLVYIMDKKAMQLANLIANKLFGISFSWLLGQRIKDTLCGTKVLWKSDYEKIAENRNYFGDFDPFGDFDLLFGAAKLNLKIIDIPIHYKERSYGDTNIQRWKHGVILLKMMLVASKKLKFT
jgi:SAM-dependent methyltransferase